jgi:phenylacetate-CoA ligase
MVEFQIRDFFHPFSIARTYFLLRCSERWSPAQMAAYQSQRLAKLLRYCASEVPYYRRLFRETGLDAAAITAADAQAWLRKLPILDKDTLRQQGNDFLSSSARRFHPKAITTSGTTGTPLTVYWDKGSNVLEFCSMQRLWRWAGLRVGQPFLDLRSRVFDGTEKHLIRRGPVVFTRNWKANGLEFSSDYIDASNLPQYYEVLLQYRPVLVRGHPQAIQHLASLLRRHDMTGWRPKAVTTASEALYDFQRREIDQTWHVPILDSYGLKEHNVFIAQCGNGGYHVFPEYGICEILDDMGKPVGPGEEGWVVATGLHNYAQPLLRYHTRDRAVAGDGALCSCGRTLPTVQRIVGRIDDCLYTRDGKRFSGLAFAFFGRDSIKSARLCQEDWERVTVELVVTPQFTPGEQAALVKTLEHKTFGKLRYEVRLVDRIVQQTAGKFKFVVSRLQQEPKGTGVSERRAEPRRRSAE